MLPAPLAQPLTAWALVSPTGELILRSISARLGGVAAYCERFIPHGLRAFRAGFTATQVEIRDLRTARVDPTEGVLDPLIDGAAR